MRYKDINQIKALLALVGKLSPFCWPPEALIAMVVHLVAHHRNTKFDWNVFVNDEELFPINKLVNLHQSALLKPVFV